MELEVNGHGNHYFLQGNQVIEMEEQSENLNSEINQASCRTCRNIQSFGDRIKNCADLNSFL